MTTAHRNLIAASLWIFSLGTSHAHDFWLEPDVFTPAENQPVAVSLRFGESFRGDTLPFISDRFNDFSIINENGRASIQSRLGDDPAATISATAGGQLLGYQSEPQFVEVDAIKFNQYIVDEGIEYIRAERERRGESDSPAPENFIRCAKALIQTGPPGQEIYRQKLGYTLELVPQSDPYQLNEGDTLEFVLLYQNRPIEGLQIQALRKADPENVQKVRTDENGKASLVFDEQGTWLVKVVLIAPIAQRQKLVEGERSADWQSYWASYVFELVGT